MSYAHVALPIPVDRLYTYSIPGAMRDAAAPGMRAVVNVKGRVETGYIVSFAESSDIDGVKPIIELPDATPCLSDEMLRLCRWLADYYCCSWGEALQCAVPSGIRVRENLTYRLAADFPHAARFTEVQRKIIGVLHSKGPLRANKLNACGTAVEVKRALAALQQRRVVETESAALQQRISALTETYVSLIEESAPGPDELAALQRRAPKQAAVFLDLYNGEPERLASALYERHGADSTILRALEKRGWIRRIEKEIYRIPGIESDGKSLLKLALNDEQQRAFDAVTETMDAKRFEVVLLKGITGSGKTEVYLQAIEHALSLGRTAIMLVPEISLTPQTVGRFMSRFREDIAVLHSGLGAGERYDEWRRAQRGEVRIVVGARSAIFAPLNNLGIIVVDEEHDNSYKQGENPRYHARDVAIMRAKMNDAVCVLGSATPSVESYYNSESGKSKRIVLNKRATSGVLPSTTIVDMRIETKEESGHLVLSRLLENAVNDRVKKKEQCILLLNRRGFAPFVLCPQCGWVAECYNCNVSMTYHSSGGHLSCHYCNAKQPVPQVCEKCHFNPLLFVGMGTQKAEDYLLHAFPSARVERMDADTTSGKGGHAKILGRFAKGDIDILIGTQMLAKGHDFPGVTLVGIINADAGLALPDFRAAENTFQLLTQVSGRAGRGDIAGEVIIQTYRPNHYAVQAAAKHDYDTFYAQEIKHREHAGYPPFRRMGNFAIESESPEDAERATMRLSRMVREKIAELAFTGMEVLGPAPATVKRVKKKYRWNLGVLSQSAKRVNTLARETRNAFEELEKGRDVVLKIDLDPYGVY
jgi:primosomal protein N' (replication factor Y)